MLFTWCNPIISYVNKTNNLQHACQCTEMEEKDSTSNLTSRIVHNFDNMINASNFNYRWGIVKLMMVTFKIEIILIILLGCLIELLSLGTVFLTSFFVDWIKDEDSTTLVGFAYVLSLSGLLIVTLVFRQQYFMYGKVIGINVRKAICGMIYK